MTMKRMVPEIGIGTDIRGADYTKAALRAVQDAMHHSSLSTIHPLRLNSKQMQVEATIGVQHPDKVDAASVQASLPDGKVTVKVVKSGLDVPDDDRGDIAVVASSAVAVRFESP
jgi:uncharacterized protein (TIGR02058 family)